MAAIGQGRLIQIYEEAFDRYDLKVAQILPTRDDLTHRARYLRTPAIP